MDLPQLKRALSSNLTGRQFKVLTTIIALEVAEVSELIKITGVASGHIYPDLKKLWDEGLVDRDASGRYMYLKNTMIASMRRNNIRKVY
jgi:DNA-binding MarR family transcriptional regulator